MIDTDFYRHQPNVTPIGRASCDCPEPSNLATSRVTKGVGAALGKAIAVDRDGALPDRLASLVERLQAGPLGQTKLKPLRVA